MAVRIGVFATYVVLLSCGAAIQGTIDLLGATGQLVRAISDAAPERHGPRLRQRHRDVVEVPRSPGREAEVVPPHVPSGYDGLPDGELRRERGSALDAPRPAR